MQILPAQPYKAIDHLPLKGGNGHLPAHMQLGHVAMVGSHNAACSKVSINYLIASDSNMDGTMPNKESLYISSFSIAVPGFLRYLIIGSMLRMDFASAVVLYLKVNNNHSLHLLMSQMDVPIAKYQ